MQVGYVLLQIILLGQGGTKNPTNNGTNDIKPKLVQSIKELYFYV